MTETSPGIKRAARLLSFGIPIAFLALTVLVSLTLFKRVPWQKNDYSFRIPIDVSKTSSKSDQGIVSLVIPRADLPIKTATAFYKLQATTFDGRDVATQLGLQDLHYPLVVWVLDAAPGQTGRYYLYLKPVTESPAKDNLAKPPFLLFDTFEDSWMAGWDREPLSKENAPFSWMAGLTLASRTLPEDLKTGYTIEALAQQATSGSGGPAIVVAGEGLAISWGRLDDGHFMAQIGSDPSFEVTLPASTKTGEPFELRVDVPRLSGAPVRFFLNSKVLLERPLPKNLTGPVHLFLLRRTEEGVAYFRWLGARPYQINEPEVKVGEFEARESAK